MRISNTKYGVILSLPGLILLLIWVLIPFSYVFYLSFLRYDHISPVVPAGLENYTRVLTDPDLPVILGRTFVFSFGSTGLTLFISLILVHW
jgi:multiple sugar transport system permease protein